MANHRRRPRRHLDVRGPGECPCPCCGYRTLHEGPGKYDLCPVCWWEDAGEQLRWPTLAAGPNGISLIQAQRNFVELGACHAESIAQVRKPKPGEEREPGWRPIDPALDDFESGPDDPRNLPWPAAEHLYWWRPDYFRRPENQRPGPVPRQPPSNAAEQMMARILEVAPETEAIDINMRSRWEQPAPLPFCGELASFVVKAVQRGDTDVALRIVNELNAGLISGDDYAATCVCIGFLEALFEWSGDADERPPPEKMGLRSAEMAEFVDRWPPEIKAELRRQAAHQDRVRRKEERLWGPPQPDGSWKVPLRWKLRHPILWWKMRHGGIRIAG
jgi:hypothetical protein